MARHGCLRDGPEVQLRYRTELTFDDYVRAHAWLNARLETCPLCPPGTCAGIERFGTYMRKVPGVAYVTRFRCLSTGVTIGLLPDFYASRVPGTLQAWEDAAARAEEAPSIEAAANELRPPDVDDAVTLPTAIRWVRLRLVVVHAMLATVRGLLPDLFARCEITVKSFRAELGTGCVLMALREICDRHLYVIPAPLGLVPPPSAAWLRWKRNQQSSGPDPPPTKA